MPLQVNAVKKYKGTKIQTVHNTFQCTSMYKEHLQVQHCTAQVQHCTTKQQQVQTCNTQVNTGAT